MNVSISAPQLSPFMEPSRSANSKRTSNSNWSNNKKKKTNQKTLGMAWGAKSRSSSRPSFNASPFSDFGSYMASKNQKLHEQFDAEASRTSLSGPSSSKPIFHGVSIFVDGYTVPSSQELRGYMLKHGGRFENYFSRRRVTHIICSNLPDSKVKNLRSFSRGLPVVKPTWVLDSVAANNLLNWVPYQLDQLASEVNNQPKLSAFFTKNIAASDDTATCSTVQATCRVESPLSYSGPIEDPISFEEWQSAEDLKPCALESKDLMQANYNVDRVEESSGSMSMQELSDAASGDGIHTPFSALSSPHNDASARSDWTSDHVNEGPSNLKIPRSPNQRHSTLVDANFVENYFKHSRLHFIGTWRNRYRKRFPSSPDGFRCSTSVPSSSVTANKMIIIHVDMIICVEQQKYRQRIILLEVMVDEHLCELPVKAIPGIDHVLKEKLNWKQITTCGQLRMISKETLQKDFGAKTGSTLWNYSRGIDDRLVGIMSNNATCAIVGIG